MSSIVSTDPRPGAENAEGLPPSAAEHADLASMRVDYTPAGPQGASAVDEDLEPEWLTDGWLPVLRRWLRDAAAAGLPEPNAMVLGTVDEHGRPVTRTVLCKGVDADGVAFFTNYDSDKGRQLAATPYASATFTWVPIFRQVTVRGPVERVGAQETAEYWHSRPRGSRLGAWASQQSRPIESRAALEHALVEVAERYGMDAEIPVPPHWGGLRIRPESVEFWQGRPNRLHNRVRTRLVDGRWLTERLQP
ncbi:Pyridoxine 5'-phosphate oxidase [Rhodococcus ruber]|uniref:Pyridoxine/pyridoxamine 5'-phosphate oxidase n=2 Tax=Nocardiaceae TaxID=85025 RepID=A0A098BQV2_9NOCA|nr:pyridoxamine 5'-phosphate oxidase [Rhodococcus ruber]AXY50817.1 pyridoxamine 5'-phosphate oxidase [Rhodococcus ruber]CDZ91094.1 Pyridoxine/pyridoxamine 5'-phosphate oxidase [Rhodococcus ruber]